MEVGEVRAKLGLITPVLISIKWVAMSQLVNKPMLCTITHDTITTQTGEGFMYSFFRPDIQPESEWIELHLPQHGEVSVITEGEFRT